MTTLTANASDDRRIHRASGTYVILETVPRELIEIWCERPGHNPQCVGFVYHERDVEQKIRDFESR